MAKKDKRTKLVNEILNGIKVFVCVCVFACCLSVILICPR